jgi:hypothetical protein
MLHKQKDAMAEQLSGEKIFLASTHFSTILLPA